MAKEDDLKIVELKVSVNCCEGCTRKVLKALSIKGVLKTEIHPTLPKVTVTGSVDVHTLIKKLAKCGKTAEVYRVETQKPEREQKLEDTNKETNAIIINGKEGKNKKKSSSEPEQSSKSGECHTSNPEGSTSNGDHNNSKGSKNASSEASVVDAPKIICPTVVTTIPPVNCVINQGLGQGPPTMMASHARVYYPMEPYAVQPMGYYTVSTYSTPPPCCMQDHHHHEYPVYHPPPPPPPPMHSQATGFADYFNDENTVGCRIM